MQSILKFTYFNTLVIHVESTSVIMSTQCHALFVCTILRGDIIQVAIKWWLGMDVSCCPYCRCHRVYGPAQFSVRRTVFP